MIPFAPASPAHRCASTFHSMGRPVKPGRWIEAGEARPPQLLPKSGRQTERSARMPPMPGDHDAIGDDPALAGEVLADRIDVVEAAALDRQDGGVADAAGFEAAEFRP